MLFKTNIFFSYIISFLLSLLIITNITVSAGYAGNTTPTKNSNESTNLRTLPNSEWKKKLPSDVYLVTRCSATELPFSGKYWNNHEPGIYRCSNCGAILFNSKDKYDSGTGWPSFTKPEAKQAVDTRSDKSLGMSREEVICSHCGAHLGHVFDDGPKPSGQRYCINSASLNFDKATPSKVDRRQ